MDYTFACTHPLKVTRSDGALVALEVFVVEVALLHVGDSFKSTVGVVWEASRESDFKIVEHEEGI